MDNREGSFERFTERARKVLTLAQEEAQRFNHNYIGTEHLLLGLVREGEGVAARVLSNLGIELTKVRTHIEFIIGRGAGPQLTAEIGLTPRAKKVIELAVDEARRLGHHYVGTEHLLLGLIREGEGIAAGVLENLGVNLEKVRSEVMKVLTQWGSSLRGNARSTPPPADRAAETGHHWAYLAVPVAFREGSGHILPFFADEPLPANLAHLRIHHALRILGEDGWELAGIDPSHQTDEGPGALYIFKRPG